MSLMFDRVNSEACAASHASALAPPDLPISVTCWVYVEAQPGQSETHTVWWFGRDGIDSQFVKLVFEADAQGDIKFQASFHAVAPVTRQGSWELLYHAGIPNELMFTDTGALSAPGAYAHRKSASIWPTFLDGSGSPNQLVSIEGGSLECNSLSLSFYGTDGGGSSPYHAIGALWVVRTLEFDPDTEYRGTFLCEFELELGGQARHSTGGILPDSVKWVKSINVVKDRALFPGVRIVGQEGDAPPELILDGIGGLGYVLELRCRKPDGADGSAMAAVGAMRRIL